jgi:hypothetical protein
MDDPLLSAGSGGGEAVEEHSATMNLDEAFKTLGWGTNDWPSTQVCRPCVQSGSLSCIASLGLATFIHPRNFPRSHLGFLPGEQEVKKRHRELVLK